MAKTQPVEDTVEQLKAALDDLPAEARDRVAKALADCMVAEGRSEQLALILGNDGSPVESISPVGHQAGTYVKGQPRRGVVHPKNKLNDLAGNAWSYFTKTVVQTSYPSELGHKLRRGHYANKPPSLGDRPFTKMLSGASPRHRRALDSECCGGVRSDG